MTMLLEKPALSTIHPYHKRVRQVQRYQRAMLQISRPARQVTNVTPPKTPHQKPPLRQTEVLF